MLHELSRDVGALAQASGRHIHLVLENDDNRATLLDPAQDPPRGQYRAQWNDDYHHAWHVLLTGESRGYYSDYAPDPLQHLMQALRSGFAYQGEASPHRAGQLRGEPSGGLAPAAFVNFLQNHDQIGNRPFGDRLDALAPAAAIEAALAITLLTPMIPMLFMGEQWGSTAPFPFFCDFAGDLAEAVRSGRRKEFAGAYATHGDEVPDPLDPRTFQSAVLDWDGADSVAGRQRLDLVQRLLKIRRRAIVPQISDCRFGDASLDAHGLLSAHWQLGSGGTLRLIANLSDRAVPQHNLSLDGTILWGGDLTDAVPPWAVYCRIKET
jgi:1,4-alpha-glucan branching enzyme/maltooligosyltrehalose trehalohydrolase